MTSGDCLARPIALQGIVPCFSLGFYGELPDFHPIRPNHLDIIAGKLLSCISLTDWLKRKPCSLHVFVCLDVCLVIYCLNNYVRERKKTNYPIYG